MSDFADRINRYVGSPDPVEPDVLPPYRRMRLYRRIAWGLRPYPEARGARVAAAKQALEARREWHREILGEALRIVDELRSELPAERDCHVCGGTGRHPDDPGERDCPLCLGSGRIPNATREAL